MSRSDVVIIGSGISGLTSAILLAQKGKTVTVLEQAAKPGGYMHSFKRFGELYDTGAHYVGAMGAGQPFHTLLSYLGVLDESQFTPLDPSGFDILHFPEGAVSFPRCYAETISELSTLFPNERSAIQTYFRRIQEAIKYFPTYEFNDLTELEIPASVFEESLKSVVESLTTNQRLQSVLYAYCNLHGVSPEDVAFGFHAIVTDSLVRGPYGLNAGGDALTKKFVDRIHALGGKVILRQQVGSLKVIDRLVKEVHTTTGEVYEADWVISSLHPKATFSLLSDQSFIKGAFNERLKSLRESIGIFGIYAVAEKPLPLNPKRNYYFFRSSDPKAMFADRLPTEEPNTVFVSCPKREWTAGKYPLSLHAPGPYQWFDKWRDERYGRRTQAYVDFKHGYEKTVLGLVDKYHQGFSEQLSQTVSSSPLTHLHFNGSEQGSSYGLYHSISNTGPRAMGPRTKVLNLLLTGQNYLFPGLMGAAVSALRTTGHIIGIKATLGELKAHARQHIAEVVT
jgi:all-trans-retinol 13,14-reductase